MVHQVITLELGKMAQSKSNTEIKTNSKILGLVLASFLVVMGLEGFAQTVSQEKALAFAQNFYNTELSEGNSLKSAQTFKIASIENTSVEDELKSGIISPAYFIINVGENNGFVIVSGDERFQPVLGYSSNGGFDPEDMPESMVSFLNNYKNEITDILSNDTSVKLPKDKKWKSFENGTTKSGTITSEFKLISTTWGQGKNYNDFCPEDKAMVSAAYNGHVPAGCAAVVMSQILKYWGWPTTGVGNNCYVPSNNVYGELCANFESASYNYSNMDEKATSPNNDIAQLIFHSAVAVKTNFSASGSSAFSSATVKAFINNFKFSEKAEFVYRAGYSDTEWSELLKSHLDHNIPLYYRGDNEGKSAHAFICDGYDQAGRFHFNWGWDGRYDGFYAISAMEPINNYNYNSNQGVIINLFPDNNDFSVEDLTADNTTVNKGGNIELSYKQVYTGSNYNGQEVAFSYWLSSDSNIDENDIFLGEDLTTLSSENSIVNKTAGLALADVREGSEYFIIVVAETSENTKELNVSNNISAIKITIANSESAYQKSTMTTSAADFSEASVSVYPNPTKEKVFINANIHFDNDVTITLMDMRGTLLEKKSIGNNDYSGEFSFDLSSYTDGQYIVGIYSADGSYIAKKVMKKGWI